MQAPRWMLTLNSQRRFYYKGFVWMIAGVMVEIYRQLVNVTQPQHVSVPETEWGARR